MPAILIDLLSFLRFALVCGALAAVAFGLLGCVVIFWTPEDGPPYRSWAAGSFIRRGLRLVLLVGVLPDIALGIVRDVAT